MYSAESVLLRVYVNVMCADGCVVVMMMTVKRVVICVVVRGRNSPP